MSTRANDWQFCTDSLVEVSRSFSIPIRMLPTELEHAVTMCYLLCRIADTIEDHHGITLEVREELYRLFLDCVERGGAAEPFSEAWRAHIGPEGPEHRLCVGLPIVMRFMATLRGPLQEILRQWVPELTRGMSVYTRRRRDQRGLVCTMHLRDMERYCYFVAGAVAHMLTDFFLVSLPDISAEKALEMKKFSESFGLGLQFVNILKDITDDLERGWCFIPRDVLAERGLHPRDLVEPANFRAAHDALGPVFERAFMHLEDGLRYTMTIPAQHREVRLFCMLPLWMAIRTLVHARHNDDQFIAGRAVKISRDEVARITADIQARCQDDDALREGYRLLTGATPITTRSVASA